MGWFLTLLILAAIAWLLIRWVRARAESDGVTARHDPLEHDHDGADRSLPEQRASTADDAHDPARVHVGTRREESPGGRPNEAGLARGPGSSGGDGLDSATLAVPGSPEPGVQTDRGVDAGTAARAAHDSENSGSTGTAVLAGIATAASAGIAGAAAREDERGERRDADEHLTNPPDPETAGSLELDGRGTDSAAVLREEDALGGRADTSDAAARTVSDTPPGETASGQSVRDNAATNAPVADTAPEERARDVVDVPAANVAAAEAPAEDHAPEQRTNAPEESTAGEGAYRDRSIDARSNVIAGTASLALGGATRVGAAERLPNGRADLRAAHGESSDASRLEGGDSAANVREMMKILNLREADATRLGISKDEFAQLWQRDGGAPPALVDDVAGRLRRMLD